MGSVAAVDGAEVDAGSDGGATVLLFATSGLIDGNLMGLAGADTRCEGFAVQGALAGNYVALLATTLLDAFARLPEGRYVNTRGATLFSKKPTRASVLEGAILDEKGAPAISAVWTGADATVGKGGACDDWLIKLGISGWTGRSDMATTWFKDKTMGCSTLASLYCVRTP